MTKENDRGREAMNQQSASRIQSAAARNQNSSTAKSGFAPRAQSAAAHGLRGQGNSGQSGQTGGK